MQTEEKIFVPLTNDVLFKETYGNTRNMKHLEDLLECYFDYPRGYLKDKVKVSYESQLEKINYSDKAIRGDLTAVIDNDFIVELEMYKKFDTTAVEKSEYYVMRIAATQLKRSDNYSDIKKIVQINFADKTISTFNELKTVYKFGYTGAVEGHIISLDKVREIKYTLNDRLLRLLNFIGSRSEEERRKVAEGDSLLMDLNAWLDEYSNDELVKEGLSEDYWKQKMAYNDGKSEEKIDTAQNMLTKGYKPQEIADITGLSLEEITKLQEAKGD